MLATLKVVNERVSAHAGAGGEARGGGGFPCGVGVCACAFSLAECLLKNGSKS